MIFDRVNYANQYKGISENLDKALDFMSTNNLKELECGHYPIDGENVFANVMEYTTKSLDEGLLESHKKYLDIHMLITGQERVLVTARDQVENVSEYNADRDIQMHKGATESDNQVGGDYFIICFPQDLHMPAIAIGQPEQVRKLVIKVKA